MPAYAIGQVQIQDPSWVEEYGAKIQPVLDKHGGRYMIRTGEIERLEGVTPLPNVIVVVEFPSMEHARAWYADPEYAPLLKLRQGGSQAELVLVEGL